MKLSKIHQDIEFKASPREVYDCLLDSKKHSKFTGSYAHIDNRVGGKFSAYDAYIEGENIELIPGKKIVQSWRADDWAVGVYSTVTYDLSAVSGGCKLTFTQTGVPEEHFDEIAQGWNDYYWEPMKEYFSKK